MNWTGVAIANWNQGLWRNVTMAPRRPEIQRTIPKSRGAVRTADIIKVALRLFISFSLSSFSLSAASLAIRA